MNELATHSLAHCHPPSPGHAEFISRSALAQQEPYFQSVIKLRSSYFVSSICSEKRPVAKAPAAELVIFVVRVADKFVAYNSVKTALMLKVAQH